MILVVQFMDFYIQIFIFIMKLKNGGYLVVNRNCFKVVLVIYELDFLDDKDDIVGIYDFLY